MVYCSRPDGGGAAIQHSAEQATRIWIINYTDFGSVTNYSTKTSTLTLEHNYPRESKIKAIVDVELLVNTLKSEETQIGEWVNVIGYIQDSQQQKPSKLPNEPHLGIRVQAIVLWSSGPLKLDGYEKSLDLQKSDGQKPGKAI